MSKTIEEQIEILTHYKNGGEVVVETWLGGNCCELLPNVGYQDWNFKKYNFRIKNYEYPIFFKSESGTIFRYDSLTKSVCLKNGIDCGWVLGESLGFEHTMLHETWVQFNYKEAKKTVTIERWLIKNNEERYDVAVTSDIKHYIDSCIGWQKVKLLETYEVEL